MEKIWYIKVSGKKEGPYSVGDLARDTRITPDTPVWRKGFLGWVPLRKVPELRKIFEFAEPDEDQDKTDPKSCFRDEDAIVALQRVDPPSFYYWILAALIVILFTLYQLFFARS